MQLYLPSGRGSTRGIKAYLQPVPHIGRCSLAKNKAPIVRLWQRQPCGTVPCNPRYTSDKISCTAALAAAHTCIMFQFLVKNINNPASHHITRIPWLPPC
jgi:hypothetical protein